MVALPHTYTGPGLIDLQVNGYAGFDFNAEPSDWGADALQRVRSAMARRGVVACLPTLTTDAPERMVARAARYAELVEADDALAAFYPKLHVEGPFLSPDEGPRGAHPPEHCRAPDDLPDLVDRLFEAAAGRVGIVTVAPELPGALDVIARCARAGVCPAIGHTQASAEQIDAAIDAGARMSTHLGNGSHQMLPRLDNYVQYELAADRLYASFIADGHHIPFTTLKSFLRAKTIERSVLVTDAVMPAELPPGEYVSEGRTVVVTPAGRVSIPGQANLAGSALTLDRAVINVCLHCDVAFEDAWRMASTQPAALAGLETPPSVTVSVTREGFAR